MSDAFGLTISTHRRLPLWLAEQRGHVTVKSMRIVFPILPLGDRIT
ncbi:MAG: hypothetical protein AAGJ40_23555 [Planctomycetota bacterium]